MDFENELWKEIEGYGRRYQVSNCGRIWNVATQSMMKPQLKKTGYLCLNLMKPNKKLVSEGCIGLWHYISVKSRTVAMW